MQTRKNITSLLFFTNKRIIDYSIYNIYSNIKILYSNRII